MATIHHIEDGQYFYIDNGRFLVLYKVNDYNIECISHYWTLKDLKEYVKSDSARK